MSVKVSGLKRLYEDVSTMFVDVPGRGSNLEKSLGITDILSVSRHWALLSGSFLVKPKEIQRNVGKDQTFVAKS